MKTKETLTLTVVCLVAGALRFWLMRGECQNVIAERFEVTTPVNSWKRVTEALFLIKNNVDPYSGDRFHEPPLFLFLYKFLVNVLPENVIFLVLDIWTACVLYWLARKQMEGLYKEQEVNKDKVGGDVIMKLLRGCDFLVVPFCIVLVYLFNPFTLLNCVGRSTTVFSNFFIALFLLYLEKGSDLAAFWLSLAIVHSFYSIVLVVPLLLKFAKRKRSIAVATITLILALVCVNFVVARNWTFLKSTYGFLLTASDLQPNVGIFWYFFTEMFEHFEMFYLCCLQINVTILYLTAMSIKLRKKQLLLSFALLSISVIFKPYPCVGDFGFILSLLPLWSHFFAYMKHGLLVLLILLLSVMVGPTFSYLWLYARSANANFYFGATLAFNVAQILLLIDILFANTKREFFLKNKKNQLCQVVLAKY